MNNEIKEILELFASTDENIMFGDIVELNAKQSHLLLDYITNLQEENEQLKEYIKVAKVSEWFKGNDKLDKLLGDDNEKDI